MPAVFDDHRAAVAGDAELHARAGCGGVELPLAGHDNAQGRVKLAVGGQCEGGGAGMRGIGAADGQVTHECVARIAGDRRTAVTAEFHQGIGVGLSRRGLLHVGPRAGRIAQVAGGRLDVGDIVRGAGSGHHVDVRLRDNAVAIEVALEP